MCLALFQQESEVRERLTFRLPLCSSKIGEKKVGSMTQASVANSEEKLKPIEKTRDLTVLASLPSPEFRTIALPLWPRGL